MNKTAFEFRVRGRSVIVYRVAEPGWKFAWNDYPGKRIGCGFVMGKRCLSLVWRQP